MLSSAFVKSLESTTLSASKVLLVCVYDTVVLNITYDLIRPKFQQFGTIIKMLIFEKGEVTKLFVEYAEIDHAVKV